MLRIGLTGGIGAGKSTVSHRLARLGAMLVDADQIAHEVVAPGSPGLRQVIDEFGSRILDGDGALDRPELARVVFSDPEARTRLNGIVHPLVGARTQELIASAPPDAIVVQDIPLLVESGMAPSFPLVVVVHAAPEERIRRLVTGRGMSEQDAMARIAAQADEPARRAVADVWLDNSGDQERLRGEVDRLWRDRLVPCEFALRSCGVSEPPSPLIDQDPGWPEQFERLSRRIARAARVPEDAVRHIGSTSVPGLAARDVLDVQLSVPDQRGRADGLADQLLAAGFVPSVGPATFRSADPARPLDLYVRIEESAQWRLDLLFRDWLRSDPAARAGYLAAKRRARQCDDVAGYAEAKDSWFAAARDSAERWVDSAEWSTPGLRRTEESVESGLAKGVTPGHR
jgi:dephospho-CoA kinase